MLGFVLSVTVVFGCRFAVPFVTYRPVIAERFLPGIAFTSFLGQTTRGHASRRTRRNRGVEAACGYALGGTLNYRRDDRRPGPPPVTDAERSRRNARIVAARASGQTEAEVAAHFGVARSTVRKIVADERHARSAEGVPATDLLLADPADVLRAALSDYEWASGRLRGIAEGADNDSAAVGAVRALIDATDRRLKLFVAAGVLTAPETARVMRLRAVLEDDKARFARALVDLLDRRGLDSDDVAIELGVGPKAVAA